MSRFDISCRGDGRRYLFEPQRTALIVIDMQRHFLGDAPAVTEVAAADDEAPSETAAGAMDMRAIIPRVARLTTLARALGCHVVHTREGYGADLADVSDFRRTLGYVGHDGPLGRTLIRGEAGHDFVDELRPLAGEDVIDKAAFGAFSKTGLDERLRAFGVTHLMLCGVTTQCCVHSTLREAVDLGYWCLTIADCCAATETRLHEAALMLIAGEGDLFGWVADLADVEAGTGLCCSDA